MIGLMQVSGNSTSYIPEDFDAKNWGWLMSNHFTSCSLLLVPAKNIVMRFCLPGLLILLFTACSNMPMMKPATESRGHAESGEEVDGTFIAGPLDSSLRSLEPKRPVPAGAAKLFRKATKALAKGIERGVEKEGDANLLLGIAYYNQNERESAARAFRAARKHEESKTSALRWIEMLDGDDAKAAEQDENLS